jgi:hypothetical protein
MDAYGIWTGEFIMWPGLAASPACLAPFVEPAGSWQPDNCRVIVTPWFRSHSCSHTEVGFAETEAC